MPPESRRSNPWGDALETARQKRLDSIDSGNYRRLTKTALDRFLSWAATDRGVSSLEEIDREDMIAWIDEDLRPAVRRDEITGATAQNYYRCVRASFTAWQKRGMVSENPAKNAAAEDELPEATSNPDRQYWSEREISAVLSTAHRRVDEALADGSRQDRDVVLAMRDRAIVLLLAYSGARGAELFRVPDDRERAGITWGDLDWEHGVITVLGKTRKDEDALLPERVQDPLDRYQTALAPASASWPVFPSLDHATLYSRIREALSDRGWDETAIEAALESADPIAVCRDYDIRPRALTVRSARNVMRRLCEAADVAPDGEYLKPHGGRRGLGDRLYDEQAELAQEALRHKNIETTHESYRKRRVERTRQRVDDVLEDDKNESGGVPESYDP